jgi:hypothetical protein
MAKIQVLALEHNIELVSKIYSDTLLNIRDEIEEAQLYKKKLNLKKLLKNRLPDGIGEIFILNKDLDIINALYASEDQYKSHNLSHRNYIHHLKLNPFKVHIDKPSTGRVTRSWMVPMSVAIKDTYNKFNGAVIFSITLTSFSKLLNNTRLTASLQEISYSIEAVKLLHYSYNLNLLNASPKVFFIKNILLSSSNDIVLSFQSAILNNQLSLIYNISDLKTRFYKKTAVHFLILYCLGLSIIILRDLFRSQIYLPLKILTNEIASIIPNERANIKSFSIQENIQLIESLTSLIRNIIIKFNEFSYLNDNLKYQIKVNTNILKNVLLALQENQKMSHEFIEDFCTQFDQYELVKVTNIIKELESSTDDLIKFSLTNVSTKLLLLQEINVYQLIVNIYGQEAVNHSSEYIKKSSYLFYKEPFEKALQIIKYLLTSIFNIKLSIQLNIDDKMLIITFSMIPIEALTSIRNHLNFFELQLILYINKGKFFCATPDNDFQDIYLSFPLNSKL